MLQMKRNPMPEIKYKCIREIFWSHILVKSCKTVSKAILKEKIEEIRAIVRQRNRFEDNNKRWMNSSISLLNCTAWARDRES